jgi:hypothetical protein
MDSRATKRGQGWVTPKTMDYEMTTLLTVVEAAEFCQVQVKTVFEWRRRGLVITATPDGTRYKVLDLLDYQASRRRRRVAS